jgi:hypothetical protein
VVHGGDEGCLEIDQITSVRSGTSSGSGAFLVLLVNEFRSGVLLRLAAAGAGVHPGAGGHGEFRAGPVAVQRRGCGARHPGLLALRSASGLGPPAGAGGPAPTAFNRAGEKVRATRGELPRVICEVILGADAGSLSPHRGEGLGHRCGGGPRGAAQAASA